MASSTVTKAQPGARVKIAPRLYEYGQADGRTFSYYADVEIEGRQVRRKLAATTRTAAREEQQNLNADNNRNLVAAPTKKTLSEVAGEWFAQLDLKPRSHEQYEFQLRKNVLPFLGTRAIQSIRPRDCAALQRWLKDERKLSPASQSAALTCLNSVFKFAVREEYVLANPLDRIEKGARKQRRAPHRYLSPTEVTRLLEHSNGYTSLFSLCVYTGLRINEALGLVWGDIDLTAGTITVQAQLSRATKIADAIRVPTKTDETREVNIDGPQVELLRDLKTAAFAKGRAKADDFIFTAESGNPLLYRNVWEGFDVAATKAGLNPEGARKLRPHDLRRTAASILINAGLPAPFVAAQLGHTVQVLYSTYTGLLEAQEGTNREAQLVALAAYRAGG